MKFLQRNFKHLRFTKILNSGIY